MLELRLLQMLGPDYALRCAAAQTPGYLASMACLRLASDKLTKRNPTFIENVTRSDRAFNR
jgi:hypothetical protein